MRLNQTLLFLLSLQLHIYSHQQPDPTPKTRNWYDSSKSEKQQTKLLPLCFVAHTLKQLSLAYSAYVLITSGIALKQNIGTIKTSSWLHAPWSSLQTVYYSTQFLTVVGLALLKVTAVHYISSWLIKFTCPSILKKRDLSDHAASTDC